VADDAVLFEEIVEDHAEAKLLEREEINGDRFSALRAIAASNVGRDGLAIGDDPIDHTRTDVLLDSAKMIREGVAGSFPGLGHEIGNVDARGFGFGNRVGDFWNQEVGEDAGVEGTGPEKDEVRMLDGFDDSRKRTDTGRRELELFDGRAAGGDARFAVNYASIFECGDELNVRKR